jgi:hypothetical protein
MSIIALTSSYLLECDLIFNNTSSLEDLKIEIKLINLSQTSNIIISEALRSFYIFNRYYLKIISFLITVKKLLIKLNFLIINYIFI